MIQKDELSPYNIAFLEKKKEKFHPSMKLCPDLKDKKKYVCSLKNLQLFINNGLVLQKIHRVLVSKQSAFMAPFIKFNSVKRLEARSKFEQAFFKLMNNACYGKLIEDVRKRTRVDIVTSPVRANKLISRCQFKGSQT